MILVRLTTPAHIYISPPPLNDGIRGELWTEGHRYDDWLIHGWEEVKGCAGASPPRYRLERPGFMVYETS